MVCRRGFFYLLIFLSLLAGGGARAQDIPVFQIRRGVNFSSWLANAPRQPMFARDFRQVKEAGFDHIRLPFNPEQFGFAFNAKIKDPAAAVDFTKLDQAVAMAADHDLKLILDVHPRSAFMQTLEDNDWAEAQFVGLWKALARRYKNVPPAMIAFQLLNEPQYYNKIDRYEQLVLRLAGEIRKIAQEHTLIISAPYGSSIKGLLAMSPIVEDSLVVYDFHFYEPYILTFQGIHMGFPDKMLRYFRKLPFPSSMADQNADHYAPLAPDPKKAQAELAEYTAADWDDKKIRSRIGIAADWAKQNNVRIMCGEFGVLRNHIEPDSRYRWIAATRRALESFAIPWQLWDYADLAGIAPPVGQTSTDAVDGSIRLLRPEQGHRRIEAAAIEALGLGEP